MGVHVCVGVGGCVCRCACVCACSGVTAVDIASGCAEQGGTSGPNSGRLSVRRFSAKKGQWVEGGETCGSRTEWKRVVNIRALLVWWGRRQGEHLK